MEEFETEGSGWTLERVVNLAVNISKYQPLSASGYIDLPPWIKARHAVVNEKISIVLAAALVPLRQRLQKCGRAVPAPVAIVINSGPV